MERLRRADLLAVTRALETLYAPADLEAFPARLFALLRALVPAISRSYTFVDPRRGTVVGSMDPPDSLVPGSENALGRLIGEHPLIVHHARTLDPGPHKLSDFLTQHEYHRLHLYHDVYRAMDTEYQMAMTLPAGGGRILGVTVNRDRADFSERDRAVLDLLRPHLIQAYLHAERLSLLRGAEPRANGGMLIVDGAGQVVWAMDAAERLLARYLPDARPDSSGLPEPVRAWHAAQRTARAAGDLAPATPLTVQQAGRRLTVQHVGGDSGEQDLLLLEEAVDAALAPAALLALGLSPREAEVLGWAAAGMSNREIGALLVVSPRTVQKHLEHICAKLSVSTRTAAVARAFQLQRELLP